MHMALESTHHIAIVRPGRSLCIFSLRCRSTLQRCPKKSDNHPVKLFYCFQAVSQTQRCTNPKKIKKTHWPDKLSMLRTNMFPREPQDRNARNSDWGGHFVYSHWDAEALSKGVLRKVTVILSSSFIASKQSAGLNVVRAQQRSKKHIGQTNCPCYAPTCFRENPKTATQETHKTTFGTLVEITVPVCPSKCTWHWKAHIT